MLTLSLKSISAFLCLKYTVFSFVAGKTCFGLFAVKLGCFQRYCTEKNAFCQFAASQQRFCLFLGRLHCLQYGVWRNSLFLFSYTNCAVNPLVSAAFAPYRNRPFEFAPTLFEFDPIKSNSPLD